ncbi:MAG: hypothetical protein RBT11_06840 [Desulfobacterales bacterium]|jgi:hypothetical protein|nr:hypothetical protein [Desulfobacterales bacterium]
MLSEDLTNGSKERLDNFINRAKSGQTVKLQIKVYRNLIKQVNQSEATDDIDIETDRCLLMADFTSTRRAQEKSDTVTKVYAVCPINESDVDDRTTRHIANERLKMDYARLKDANILFEATYF